MNQEQLVELILQSLEHEQGGVKVYEMATRCAVNPDLKKEFGKYLAETRNHVKALEQVCAAMSIDPSMETPGRQVVRLLGNSLVTAMQTAAQAGTPEAAELVACECVVLAETKDHLDWELLGKCADKLEGKAAQVLADAYAEIEDQEDEHYYHTKGWCRELWLQSLGLRAVLPPPEERQHVKTAIGAAKAEQAAGRAR